MRKILEITFAGTDFNVVTVPTGDAALAKLKSESFGLIVSDITLEPQNGYELCKQLKATVGSLLRHMSGRPAAEGWAHA